MTRGTIKKIMSAILVVLMTIQTLIPIVYAVEADKDVRNALIRAFKPLDRTVEYQMIYVGTTPEDVQKQLVFPNTIEAMVENLETENTPTIGLTSVGAVGLTSVTSGTVGRGVSTARVSRKNISVEWVIEDEKAFSVDYPNTYRYTAKPINPRYQVDENTELPVITIDVLPDSMVGVPIYHAEGYALVDIPSDAYQATTHYKTRSAFNAAEFPPRALRTADSEHYVNDIADDVRKNILYIRLSDWLDRTPKVQNSRINRIVYIAGHEKLSVAELANGSLVTNNYDNLVYNIAHIPTDVQIVVFGRLDEQGLPANPSAIDARVTVENLAGGYIRVFLDTIDPRVDLSDYNYVGLRWKYGSDAQEMVESLGAQRTGAAIAIDSMEFYASIPTNINPRPDILWQNDAKRDLDDYYTSIRSMYKKQQLDEIEAIIASSKNKIDTLSDAQSILNIVLAAKADIQRIATAEQIDYETKIQELNEKKSELLSLINHAKSIKTANISEKNGADIAKGNIWVTEAQDSAFQLAINEAQNNYDTTYSVAEVIPALENLRSAQKAYLAAQKKTEDSKSTDSKSTDSKSTDSKSTDSKSTGSKSTDSKSTDSKSTGSKSTDSKSTDSKSTDSKSTGSKSTGSKSTDSKSTDSKSTDSKSTDSKSTGSKSTDSKSTGSKSTGSKSTDSKSTGSKSTESKSTDSKSTGSKSTDSKSTDSKSTESKSTGSKSTDSKSTDSKSTDSKVSTNLNNSEQVPTDKVIGTSTEKFTKEIISLPSESKGSVAVVSVTDKAIADAISKVIAESKKNKTEQNGIAIDIKVDTKGTAASGISVNLPKSSLEALVKANVKQVQFGSNTVQIKPNLEALKEIKKQSETDITVSAQRVDISKLSTDAQNAVGIRPVFEFTIADANGKKITNFGKGKISVSIPYTLGKDEKAANLVVYYIDGNGKLQEVPNSAYVPASQTVNFVTEHFSKFAVGYKSESKLKPMNSVTRAMFVTVLGRLANADVSSYKISSFGDVAADSHYLGYIEWAVKNNIAKGIGDGKFAPNQAITREEMAVVLANYAKSINLELPKVTAEINFSDKSKINNSAAEAVKAMQMGDIFIVKDSQQFDPQGTANRAEVSQIFKKFGQLVRNSTING